MNPLSVFTFYLRNIVKLLPVFAVLALAVFGISLTGVLTGSIRDAALEKVEVYRQAAQIAPNPKDGRRSVDANVKGDLLRNPNLALIYPAVRVSTYMPTLAGQVSAHIYAVNVQVMPVLMRTYSLELSNGQLPQPGTNGVALHEKLARSRGLRIGDALDPKLDSQEYLPARMQVVGILQGPTVLSLASLEYVSQRTEFRGYLNSLLALPRPNAAAALEQDLQNLDRNLVRPYTYNAETTEFNRDFAPMDTIVWSINSVVVLVLSLLAGLLNLIYFMDRMNEFGLLLGIGYSRAFVIRRALVESLLLTLVAWLFGIVFSQVIYSLLNQFVFEPRGVSLSVLNWRALQFTIPIPIMVGLFSAATVIWQLKSFDPMQMIERRD